MTPYNPSSVGKKGNIFGYPYTVEEADLILIPVAWEATVSFGAGTSKAPSRILDVSSQLDFGIRHVDKPYNYPVAMSAKPAMPNAGAIREMCIKIIRDWEQHGELEPDDAQILDQVNEACKEMVVGVKDLAGQYLNQGKIVATIGGDHSTCMGLIQALSEKHSAFGILQIDAHMDLRDHYEGFDYSHASIMQNVIGHSAIKKLVQVGIRDYCDEETDKVEELTDKVKVFFDEDLNLKKWQGCDWRENINEIVSALPDKVYISLDVDGLDPSLCPNTGTPVPGGLSFYETIHLIEQVVRSGKEIIGFDISETGNTNWDATVAARLLFRSCVATGVSRGALRFS